MHYDVIIAAFCEVKNWYFIGTQIFHCAIDRYTVNILLIFIYGINFTTAFDIFWPLCLVTGETIHLK